MFARNSSIVSMAQNNLMLIHHCKRLTQRNSESDMEENMKNLILMNSSRWTGIDVSNYNSSY